ncbi:MAG: tetratricopeptide repeat protein [Chloroflexi bacterium]|nr:MAG: tetratricopeptide repeat protein [Chloroflexota bacterium]
MAGGRGGVPPGAGRAPARPRRREPVHAHHAPRAGLDDRQPGPVDRGGGRVPRGSTLVTRHELARTLAGQARWQEAEDQLGEVLRTQGLILGDDHPDTLSTLFELANALVGQDRLEEAGSLFRETLAARRRVLGEEHPDTTAARRVLDALDADPPSG